MSTNNNFTIPLFLHVAQRAHHDDDTMEHEVWFQVAGADETRMVASVESHFFKSPTMAELTQGGVLDLRPELIDRLLILTLYLLVSEMNKRDGQEASWSMSDGSRWLQYQFPAEAPELLAELRRHVQPGAWVHDSCSITIG